MYQAGPQHPRARRMGKAVRDANGQALAYLYSRDNPDEARHAKVLTKDEARRIAANIAPLSELLGKGEQSDLSPL
jgi:K+/H+ antiporter YhaU regulatory subunit KhtT